MKKPIVNCKFCGDIIEKPTKRTVVCKKRECKNALARERYKQRLKEKECKQCGEIFSGTAKQVNCENCRGKRSEYQFKNTVEQKLVCRQCNKVLEIVTKNVTRDIPEKLATQTCDDCKKLVWENTSERMKLENPSYNKTYTEEEYKEKKRLEEEYNSEENKKIREEEFRAKTSERMRKDNPMFNKETRKKASKTIKERIESGEIVYKKGKEHHLYKGNRNFNRQVRIDLRSWTREKLEDEDFTCEKCFKRGGELQVHHIEPLRDIITDFLNRHKVILQDLDLGSEQCLLILKDIRDFHFDNKHIGMVVCPNCHAKVDKYYKQRKE